MEERKNEQIKDCIKRNRPQLERKATIDTVSRLYDVPKSTAYMLYNKVLSDEKIPFKELVDELKNQYQISYDPLGENSLPTVLIISNKEMKENYAKYGEAVGFDMTFSLFKEKPTEIIHGQIKTYKEYQLGFFTGVNNYNKIVIFACVISCKVKKEDIMCMFMDFIHHMGGIAPKTVLTDQDSATIAAINELN